MPIVRTALIVGAGISGLTTAIGLRAQGIASRVYERRTAPSALVSGGGFMLFNNALLALRTLKLDERVIDCGEIIRRHEFYSDRGTSLANWDLSVPEMRMGAPAIALRRAHLNMVLLDEAGESVTMGAHCVGVEQDAGGARVLFADGTSDEADVVIGADGMRSGVRAALRRGHDLPPRYAGYTAWQAILPQPDQELVPSGTFFNLWGRNGLRFLYCRLNPEEVYWDAIVSARVGAEFDMLRKSKREVMAATYARWPWPIPEIIGGTAEDAILPIDIFDRPPRRELAWGHGRVTLIGDAAHPMTLNLSQGAGQAIEDGVVLSRLLGGAVSVPEALGEYERLRRDRTSTMINLAHKIGAMGLLHNPYLCGARDMFMRMFFDGIVQRKTNDLVADIEF